MDRRPAKIPTILLMIAACCLLLLGSVSGDEVVPAKAKLRLNFDGATVEAVLHEYSEKTGLTLLISPALPPVKVTLMSETDVTPDEYGKAIENGLKDRGILIVRAGEVFAKVVPWPKGLEAKGQDQLALVTVKVDENGEECALRFRNAPPELVLVDYAEKAGMTMFVSKALPNLLPITLWTPSKGLTLQEYMQAIDNVLLLHGIKLIVLDKQRLGAIPATTPESKMNDVVAGLTPLKFLDQSPRGTPLDLIRSRGTNAPSVPIRLTQEEDDELVRQGVLPPLNSKRGKEATPAP